MISVQEAEDIIAFEAPKFSYQKTPLIDAADCVLAEDLIAERQHPPFHRVCMDGICIQFKDWQNGCRRFRIAGTQGAGEKPLKLVDENSCLEIMTGASLAENADCVIPVEKLTIANGYAEIDCNFKVSLMMNIHPQGSDHPKGQILARKGQILTGPEMGIAASCGSENLKIAKKPSIAVISTGTELVGPEEVMEDWQIRRSNSTAITSVLKSRGYKTQEYHFPDSEELMLQKLTELLKEYDILILSGGVSMGKFDYVPSTLKELGVEEKFHKIRQRPGKPLWFGKGQGKIVFGLPGNPVSSIIGFYRYILPQLEKSSGHQVRLIDVVLDEDVIFKKNMTYFMPVRIVCENGLLKATPNRTNGSGDYGSLGGSDGFVELPENINIHKQGDVVRFYSWKEGILV